MKQPVVSIIMSVYNGEAFLAGAIESILCQTYRDFEFIMIDDCSQDKTEKIIKSYGDKRIMYVHNEKNLGLPASLNKGLFLSHGRYIARQDHDDVSVPQRLEKEVAFLEEHPDIALVGSHSKLIDQAGHVFSMLCPPTQDKVIKERLKEHNSFCHGSVLFRKEVIKKVGAYREKAKYIEDYDLWLRIAEHYNLANIDMPLYLLRRTISSLSTRNLVTQNYYHLLIRELSRERRERGHDSLDELDLSDIGGVLTKKYGLSLKAINKFQARHIFYFYLEALKAKRMKEALSYWWRAFKICPELNQIKSLVKNVLLRVPVR